MDLSDRTRPETDGRRILSMADLDPGVRVPPSDSGAHQAWRSIMIFSAVPAVRTRPARSVASRDYYGTCLPLGHMVATMFAPCLLGCHGTVWQCPVSGDSEMGGVADKTVPPGIVR
jgi:hypothetical protein